MDTLRRIVKERREAVSTQRRRVPEAELVAAARQRCPRNLSERLRCAGNGTRIIAEMKKASPSAGLLCPAYDPAALAVAYEKAGACGLSILTEPLHFLGDAAHIRAARAVSELPILRKDFMCDPYQVLEAAAWGADVVLLIIAALDIPLMKALHETARDMGLEVLAEAHTAAELECAMSLEGAILGINSRNLSTLKTDLDTARGLAARIPPERVGVAESGIRRRHEVIELEALGYQGFLIGEALLREHDPAGRLRELRGESDGIDAG